MDNVDNRIQRNRPPLSEYLIYSDTSNLHFVALTSPTILLKLKEIIMPRQLALFCNDFNADIKIIIQNENVEYPAHKLIIGHASDVLNKMVYGNNTALATSIITLPNYSSSDFLPVLKYLYTGTVEWTLDNYHGVLEVGKYFGLSEMENLFKIYVANTVNYDTALDIYARFFDVNDYLCRTAMKIIQLVLNKILKSKNKMVKFFELPAEALSQILQMDELGILNERDIFTSIMKFVEKTNDKEIVSSLLGNQLKLIRYGDAIIQDCRHLENYLHDKLDTRWKIKVIVAHSEVTPLNGCLLQRLQLEDENEIELGSEIIQITSKGKTIRLHGLCIESSRPVYVKTKNHFKVIPCYRSKILKKALSDLMFENPIEITSNETVEIKVPVSSLRNDFKYLDNDLFSVRTTQMEEAGKNLPIEAIFISINAFCSLSYNVGDY